MKLKHAQQILESEKDCDMMGDFMVVDNDESAKTFIFRYYNIEEGLVNPLFPTDEFELDKITSPSIICIQYQQFEDEEVPVRIYTFGGWQNLIKGKL